MADQEKKDKSITVTVIVSGEEFAVATRANKKVRQLVREALEESGNEGQEPTAWVLRGDAGPIDQDLTVAEAGIADGAVLRLNPDAGEGGC
jgi:hypothetical protein